MSATATPRPHTSWLVALCQCGERISRTTYRGSTWTHTDTGEIACAKGERPAPGRFDRIAAVHDDVRGR